VFAKSQHHIFLTLLRSYLVDHILQIFDVIELSFMKNGVSAARFVLLLYVKFHSVVVLFGYLRIEFVSFLCHFVYVLGFMVTEVY